MKQFLNFLQPVGVGFGAIAVMDWFIFPGLTASNTLINILSFFLGIALWYYVFTYAKNRYCIKPKEVEDITYQAPKTKAKRKPRDKKQ